MCNDEPGVSENVTKAFIPDVPLSYELFLSRGVKQKKSIHNIVEEHTSRWASLDSVTQFLPFTET
jgi:hypothetical protein